MQQQKGSIFLRLLLNRYFTGKQDQLAKIMPKEEWDELQQANFPHKDPHLMLFQPKEWLSSIDSSWIIPTLSTLPSELQAVYKKAFPKELDEQQADGESITCFNEPLREFLLEYLHKRWSEKETTPKELLPSGELSPLLNFNRQELLEIIDLLAMYDLVEEMRQIVDKKLLQSVLQHLSSTQQHYLRVLLRQKSRQQQSTLSVRELIREGKKFSQSLHKFGLQRLALALSGQNDDFVWHLLHILDFNRAKFLMPLIQKEEIANSTHLAQLQVQHIIQFLKTETMP